MCRLFGLYANKNVNVNFSFYKADKSLVKQSYVNPSGWGIAWFNEEKWNLYKEPWPLFKSYRAEEIVKNAYGKMIISHVRFATHGKEKIENTHPWFYKNWIFAHNGIIYDELINLIKNEYRDFEGETDSEKLFHLIVQEINELNDPIEGIKNAIKKLKNIKFSSLNFIASDGKNLYALRYAIERENYYTLYYTKRPKNTLHLLSKDTKQLIEMKTAYEEKAVIIASERMTEEDWKLIENRNLIIIDENLSVKLLSID